MILTERSFLWLLQITSPDPEQNVASTTSTSVSPVKTHDHHHERTRSSPSSLHNNEGRISPRYETPPGTPPPPYYVEKVIVSLNYCMHLLVIGSSENVKPEAPLQNIEARKTLICRD